MPLLTIVAGPNGSGKSSILKRSEFVGRLNLLEADAIASRISPDDPGQAAIAAGREVLNLASQYLVSAKDFAIETTLSGSWTTRVIREARRQEYHVRLVFVCVDSPDRSIERVGERVARGGHDVPHNDIRRRYSRSLYNLKQVWSLVDEIILFDNSGAEPRELIEIRAGAVVSRSENIPDWARTVLEGCL